jgi:hypothetical protein
MVFRLDANRLGWQLRQSSSCCWDAYHSEAKYLTAMRLPSESRTTKLFTVGQVVSIVSALLQALCTGAGRTAVLAEKGEVAA